jgi:tryptophan 2,3-dioxygenase
MYVCYTKPLLMADKKLYYSNYLQLDKILTAQLPESDMPGNSKAHDEMLFVIIHQTYELWFKQILFELDSIISIMAQPTINDNSPQLQTVVHRFKRINTILKVLVQQIDVMETMTSMDFLDFRDMLRPASGFQSYQFKIIEAKLGLKFEQRYGQHYYTSQLTADDTAAIKTAESNASILQLVNTWLERMPFITSSFWEKYSTVYLQSLAEAEKNNALFFEKVFNTGADENSLSPAACRAALFIMLYRGYPMLELPFQLLDTLLETDNQLGNWRYRHMNMVQRMIGTRIGTGGSSGAGYLKGATNSHYIFRELAQLNSFLVERKKLPELPTALVALLGYK